MVQTSTPLISIICLTYNHEKFIRQALEGFVMQKTNFSFEIIVHDDASTDNTVSIIKEYEKKFTGLFANIYQKENQYSKPKNEIGSIIFSAARRKYIALCDGDDYWTDPNKLQKQVDFLESNPDHSICWTNYGVLTLNGDLHYENWFDFFKDKDKLDVNLKNFFNPYATHTLTTLFKKEAFNLTAFEKMKYAKDYTLFCMCLSEGKGAVLNFCSAVYRHGNGAFSGLSAFSQCYSNYQTLREIVKKVPACNTEHLKKFRDKQLYNSFALSIFNKEIGLKKNFSLYLKVLIHNTMLEKMQATKTMIKQLYGMRKRSWKISPANVI